MQIKTIGLPNFRKGQWGLTVAILILWYFNA